MQSGLSTPPGLRSWIAQQYQSFNHDLAAENLKNWIVCVGNEAGDLDTIASSIAFAYLSSLSNHLPGSTNKQYIPIQQTNSTDFKLRPENVQVLALIDLLDNTQSTPMTELICSDRVDFTKLTPYGATYALLDHNQINEAIFGESAEVVAVIDHHQAEAGNTLYPSAHPRLIVVPTGSCASLVTTHFASTQKPLIMPPSIADLLLSAIAIDTHNFKKSSIDDKTTDTDISAKELLLPRSTFSQTAVESLLNESDFKKFYKKIHKLKGDVSSLNSDELLKRDYKEYMIKGWSLGISSVPVPLEEWVGERSNGDWAKFLDALKLYANSKNLDVLSALTDLPKTKKSSSNSNQPPPGRRLVLMMINPSLSQINTSIVQQYPTIQIDDFLNILAPGIQDPAQIDTWSTQHHVSVCVLKTNYPYVSRKQVAPALIALIEAVGPKL